MNFLVPSRLRRRGGFLLLEIIIATAIFTVGVLSLGRCLSSCLTAQRVRAQEERAQLALQNAMVEIEARPSVPDESSKTQLKGMFKGVTLIERRRPLNLKNESNVPLNDMYEITLTAEWDAPGKERLSRSVSFALMRGRG